MRRKREQGPRVFNAAARSAALNDALRSASNPIAQIFARYFLFHLHHANPSPRHARALRHSREYFPV